jgi:hypothetical protein
MCCTFCFLAIVKIGLHLLISLEKTAANPKTKFLLWIFEKKEMFFELAAVVSKQSFSHPSAARRVTRIETENAILFDKKLSLLGF